MTVSNEEKAKCPYHGYEDVVRDGSLLDYQVQASPNYYYRELREKSAIHYDERLGMYLVSRYDDLQTIVADPVTFSSELGYTEQYAKGFKEEFKQILNEKGGGFFPDAIKTDPPYHTKIRRLLEKAFTSQRVALLEPRIKTIIEDVIAGVAKKGKADGVSDIAAPITIRFIVEQLGLRAVDEKKIQDWSYAVVAQAGRMQTREQMIHNAELICELQQFLIAEIRDRETTRREDMISDLVHAVDEDGNRLTFEEIVSLARALLIAGNETTTTAISHLLVLLATKPDIADELYRNSDDNRYLLRFTEELLRWEPPSRGLTRMTREEVEVGGVRLPARAHLLLLWASGNDTEEVFPSPRTFDVKRKNVMRHLSFGGGAHRCVGAALARLEIKLTAREIIKQLEDIRLEVPVNELRFVPTIATHPLAELPITFKKRI